MKQNNTNLEQITKHQGISYKYALCLVDVPHLGTRTFAYIIPNSLKAEIKTGQAVSVSFGNRRQNITAFVTGFSDYLEEGIKAKEIIKIIDKKPIFSPEYLKLLEWISNYYCCDINTVLQAAIPMKFLKENSSSKQKEKTEKYIIYKSKEGAGKLQLRILEALEGQGEVSLIEFEKKIKTTRSTILKLQEKNFVEIIEKTVYRSPLSVFKDFEKDEFPPLTEEQDKVYKEIEQKIDNNMSEPILLNGITGSGKTEIYFRLIKKVLNEGKNILFLAPEIALASQLTLRLIRRFNQEEIAIWHSSISDGEKFDVWNKLRENKIRIIIGARSCIFAPLNNIGLIIIDEEHENTYKQTSPAPRYDARTAAQKICEIYKASMISGSATPDVSSYFRALSSNNLITLENRYNNAELAKVTIVDMRNEFYKDSRSIFSNTLINAIQETLSANKQTILLLNRRGFYTVVQCKNCGEIIKCPNCDIPMVYHSVENKLKCHWCEKTAPMPKTCPNCDSPEIASGGMGTQRIEDTIKKIFSDANIERIDSDVLSSKTKYIEILNKFQKGETNILIGTQMIAKGLDNQNVTLVGVVDADISFMLPDYRAGERGFQLLMQAAGRAGRGEFNGRVIFQTYCPDLYPIINAKSQNYVEFYKNEISRREIFDYPPFCQIIKIVISSKNELKAEKCASEISLALNNLISKYNLTEYIEAKGALKCLMHKINNEYRFQIIIKNRINKKGQYIISTFVKSISVDNSIKMIIDIDPVDIM